MRELYGILKRFVPPYKGLMALNILLNLLLQLIEFCHCVISLLHPRICRQVSHCALIYMLTD